MRPVPIFVTVTQTVTVPLDPEDFEYGETLQEVAEHKLQKLHRERHVLDTQTLDVQAVA